MGLFDIFSSENEKKARDEKIAGLNAGYSQLADLYGQGRGALTTNYDRAAGPLQTVFGQLQGTGLEGYNAYADAAGARGAEGLARAREQFTQSPGYLEGLESGLNAIDRRAASRGMLGSGNTNLDTIKFASDYAAQKYRDYLAGLQPFTNQPTQSIAAASSLGTLFGNLGNQLNASYQGQGGAAYNTQTGIGDARAAYELSKDQTGLNILGTIFGGIDLLGNFSKTPLGGKLFGF